MTIVNLKKILEDAEKRKYAVGCLDGVGVGLCGFALF